VAAGLIYSTSALSILLFFRNLGDQSRFALIVAFAVVNIIGAFFTLRLNRIDRRRFAAFEHQLQAERLVEMMQTLLPICAGCKAVHRDDDRWEPIEEYVTSQSGQDITHGLCPACAEKHFPSVNHSS
jgi:hypothetical protein